MKISKQEKFQFQLMKFLTISSHLTFLVQGSKLLETVDETRNFSFDDIIDRVNRLLTWASSDIEESEEKLLNSTTQKVIELIDRARLEIKRLETLENTTKDESIKHVLNNTIEAGLLTIDRVIEEYNLLATISHRKHNK